MTLPSSRTLKRVLVVAVVPLLLAACGPDSQQMADYNAVGRSGVSPAIYDKMLHEDDLSISDVVALSHSRVNDGVIIRYIRDQDTTYYLSPPDFQYLRKNGVDQSVIDYMAQTAPGYNYGPGPYGPGPYGPYGPGPYGPYPYGGPVVPIGIGIGIGGGGGYGYHRWH